ncbi:MAG: substrate-binding domain-containing protein [Oscillospiraceae bacterium]|nr:substrate-binding domain-containing protein [Oscillospiraceae bacterium]
MKKIICLLLCIVLLASCSTNEPEIETPTPEPEPTEIIDAEPEISLPSLTVEQLPVIDGSTANIPLAEALVALMLNIPRSDAAELINFNGTNDSYINLMYDWSECSLIISYEPPPSVVEEAEMYNFEWELAPIGRDALVFIVNESNPVQNITTEEARAIYTGEITNWSELGGNDVDIEPFQRNETSGSQTLFIKLVMGDTPPMEPDIKYLSGGMGLLIESVASYNNTGAAIGFSVYFYAQNMNPNDGLKFLSIDGVAPTRETIQNGEYPHVNDFYAGIAASAPADSVERQILNWLQSEEGRMLIEHEGYALIN